MNKSTKGFTLVEMLVVLAILSVLTVVAVPAFGSTLQNAQRNSQRSYAQALANQLNAFNAAALTPNDVFHSISIASGNFVTLDGASPAQSLIGTGTVTLRHRRRDADNRYSGMGVAAASTAGFGEGRPFSITIGARNSQAMLESIMRNSTPPSDSELPYGGTPRVVFRQTTARWEVVGR